MHKKEPQEPPEHTSEHVKSQTFLGACPLVVFAILPWPPNPLDGPCAKVHDWTAL